MEGINLEITNPNYRRYILKTDKCAGRIVLEKYDDVWNLELMNVSPQNQGYGTMFLSKVLENENLKAENMTVCPISVESARFFKRNGFKL